MIYEVVRKGLRKMIERDELLEQIVAGEHSQEEPEVVVDGSFKKWLRSKACKEVIKNK